MNVSWSSERGSAPDPEDLRPCTCSHEGIWQPDPVGDNFPPQELLEEDIDSNRLFLYVVNGQIEAVFAFILGADPTYAAIEDGQWLDDTLPYGTVHRLASAGKHKGVGKAVLDWSMEHCQSLRADTHADNKIMQHLLEKNGFTRCGVIHVADGSPRFAYQKLAPTSRWVETEYTPKEPRSADAEPAMQDCARRLFCLPPLAPPCAARR